MENKIYYNQVEFNFAFTGRTMCAGGISFMQEL